MYVSGKYSNGDGKIKVQTKLVRKTRKKISGRVLIKTFYVN